MDLDTIRKYRQERSWNFLEWLISYKRNQGWKMAETHFLQYMMFI